MTTRQNFLSCLFWMLLIQSSSSTIETCYDVWNSSTDAEKANFLVTQTDKYTLSDSDVIRCGFVDLGDDLVFIGAMSEYGSLSVMQTTLQSCGMYEDCPYNEDDLEGGETNKLYRWSLSRMTSYRTDAISPSFDTQAYLLSTCNMDLSLTQDYILLPFHEDFVTTSFGGACYQIKEANIRGYECTDDVGNFWNNGVHFHLDSSRCYCGGCCSWNTGAMESEDNFGWYGNNANLLFSCAATSTSTTEYWIGSIVEDLCALEAGNCDENALCINPNGCVCNEGYSGDGISCVSDYQVLELSESNCNDYYQLSGFELTQSNVVGNLSISDEFEIEFDININSLPPSSYWSIFHIGNANDERLPGVWIRGGSYAWTIHSAYNSDPNGNYPNIDITDPVPLVGSQHFYMSITPTNLNISIRGEDITYSGDFDRSLYYGTTKNIYFSNPWYNAVDAVVSNICIKSPELDECALGMDDCDENASCTNTVGSFDCDCNEEYSGDGVTCCDDAFYVYDGITSTCVDINECTLGTDNCDDDATCINTEGGFTCECNYGWSGDGTECTALCEEENFVWEDLLQHSTGKPYEDTTLSITGLTLNIEARLSYLGASEADKDGFVYGTSYVIDFEDFNAHKDDIREPGTCQNRVASDFDSSTVTFADLWSYASNPYGNLGTSSYLAYPPAGVWSVDISDDAQCHVVYSTSLTWTDLTGCVGSDGTPFITTVDYENNITLAGTLYINVVSPFSFRSEFGFYRVYQLLSQPFQIVVSKTVYVLGEAGINLLTMDIIAVYKQDDENVFKLVVLTEAAEYLRLSRDGTYLQTFVPDDVDNILESSNFAALESAETGSNCLGNKEYICTQLWQITAENVQCNEATGEYTDFSGRYNLQFDALCRSATQLGDTGSELADYCDDWLVDHADEITDGTGRVLLSADLSWKDEICDAEIFTVQFSASMQFYTDAAFTDNVADPSTGHLFQVGEDTVYVKVTTDYPQNTFTVFETQLLNVWICTFNPLTPPGEIDAALGEGGCFATYRDDNSANFVEHIYDVDNGVALQQFALDEASTLESNELQFQFKVPKVVKRDSLYIHAQIEVALGAARRRMIIDTSMKKEANQMEHFVDRVRLIAAPENEPEPQPLPQIQPKAPQEHPPAPAPTPFAISPWFIAIASLLAFMLTVNVVWVCYTVYIKHGSRTRYTMIKSADSEFDSRSECDALNVVSD